MITIEIYFADLSGEKQRELLRAYKVKYPDLDMNWDTIPVTTIEVEEEEAEV